MRHRLPALGAVSAAIALWLAPAASRGAAVTDGTMGAVQALGGRFEVPQSLGTVRGANLFHSFARFGIEPGEAARFTTTDPGLRHVIARVTGGEPSVLQGPLQLQAAGGAAPDFWLLNPGGVLVGAGARFDVPAGLHLGAAPQLRFADGQAWPGTGTDSSSLSVAAPEAFGFLGGRGGTLAVRDAALLPVLGARLTLAGSEVVIERAQIGTLAAPLRLHSEGALRLGDGADLSTAGTGPDAPLQIQAAAMGADGGAQVSTWNYGATTGAELRLDIAGSLSLAGGAAITSYTLAAGAAGPLVVEAGTLSLSGSGEWGPSAIQSLGTAGPAGAVTVQVAQALDLWRGARIGSTNGSPDEPGRLSVRAGRITVDGLGEATTLSSLSSGGGPAAALEVQAGGSITLRDGGQIFGSTLGGADAGSVTVASPLIELQGGHGAVTGLYASALGAGRGGSLVVDAGTLVMTDGARISTATNHPLGSAGRVAIQADAVRIDGRGQATGIDSFAYGARGDAGDIDLRVRGALELLAGGAITAGTLGSGSTGRVSVRAGQLLIDGRGAERGFTGIAGDALFSGTGAAVDVQALQVDILEGGLITTSTSSDQPGQPLRVVADRLRIDGGGQVGTATGISADTSGSGDAGILTLTVRELVVTHEGSVSTSTVGAGRGGLMRIEADRVQLSASGGLVSVAADRGDAGRIELLAHDAVEIDSGGYIVASSGGAGAAGRIRIETGRFSATGSDPANSQRSRVASRALPSSAGDSGRIEIIASGTVELAEGALLSIANDARVPAPAGTDPSFIRVQADRIVLRGADITAAASGPADAGAIALHSRNELRLSDSALRTSADDGDGGPISLQAGGPVLLRNAAITTSVDGRDGGDGGNIRIAGPALALASGFVQANTAATRASGGTVTIDVPVLVPDGSNVFVGGNRIAAFRPDLPGYNVIQAAAPAGLAGQLDVTRPELNLAGSLTALRVQRIDFGLLGRDQCVAGIDSSFTILGRGALPAPAAAPLRIRP